MLRTTGINYEKIEGIGVLRDSSHVDIPVINVEGKESGPTLFLEATAHGPEVANIHVIHELINNVIDPKKLTGKIVIHPVSNPLAFIMGSYGSFVDRQNLTFVLPGKPDGTITERLAHTMVESAKKADYVVNMHTMYEPTIPFSITQLGPDEKKEVENKSLEMAKAFGVTTLIRSYGDSLKGLSKILYDKGIPYFTSELACFGRAPRDQVEIGVIGIKNVLKHLGMLEGEIEDQSKYTKVLKGLFESERVRATKSGVLKYYVDPGDEIKENDLIAEVRNIYGKKLEDIRSPKDAYYHAPYFACSGNHYEIFNQACHAGDAVATILINKSS